MNDHQKIAYVIEKLATVIGHDIAGADAASKEALNAAIDMLQSLRRGAEQTECDYNLALFVAVTPDDVIDGYMSIAQYIVKHAYKAAYLNQLVDDVVDDVITDSFYEWNRSRKLLKDTEHYKCKAPELFKKRGIERVNVYPITTLRAVLG